jgi:hypothetical protein
MDDSDDEESEEKKKYFKFDIKVSGEDKSFFIRIDDDEFSYGGLPFQKADDKIGIILDENREQISKATKRLNGNEGFKLVVSLRKIGVVYFKELPLHENMLSDSVEFKQSKSKGTPNSGKAKDSTPKSNPLPMKKKVSLFYICNFTGSL